MQHQQSKYHLIQELLQPKLIDYIYKPQQYILKKIRELKLWPQISYQNWINCLLTINSLYQDVPYHNLSHAFDVTINVDKYLLQFDMMNKLQINEQQRICILLAAYAHDNGHQGLTNNYYINSSHKLAIDNKFKSPLQNMHASNLMRTMKQYNINVGIKNSEIMVQIILATDNSHHYELIDQLKARQFNGQNINMQDKLLWMKVMIHTADVCNASKTPAQYNRWTKRLYQEFNKQAQLEKQNNLPVQFFMPQNQEQLCKEHLKFLSNMILPLFKQINVMQNQFEPILEGLQQNINHWKIQAQKNNK